MVTMKRVLLSFILLISLVSCAREQMPSSTDIEWDTSTSATIVKLYSPFTTAGLSGAYDDRYYIPEVQIWGDGRIIWVMPDGHQRRVLEGHLTPDQMGALLRRFIDAGFFQWEDRYQTLGGNSMPPMYLQVNLIGHSKEISEHGGAPDAYYELEELLLGGAGAEAHDYMPERGYVTARPVTIGGEAPEWPDETGVTLADLVEGRYVEGEALTFAWELVNRNPTSPVYTRSEGTAYVIMIQIPGVSFFEPPDEGDSITH